MATKQSVGLELLEHAHEVVYVINGALWICQQQSPQQLPQQQPAPWAEPDLAALSAASGMACDAGLPGIQTSAGEPRQIETSGEGCGGWMPPEFRVCAADLKGRKQQTVLRRGGAFFAQSYEEAPSILAENGRCRQVAFFHMQVPLVAFECR